MTLEPRDLIHRLDLLEQIERASLRMVTQSIYDFRNEAQEFFIHEPDLVADIGEDITREAMDRMGTSIIPVRLFGKIDYKRARYVFHPEYSLRQALFVDSKAEKVSGQQSVTIQTAQTSMRIRQIRSNVEIDEEGALPQYLTVQGLDYLVTTIFVKYNYQEDSDTLEKTLRNISITCLPNGMLQQRYNPTPRQTFWRAGRNAPSRGEAFRVRIGLPLLKNATRWRVQYIRLDADPQFIWDE